MKKLNVQHFAQCRTILYRLSLSVGSLDIFVQARSKGRAVGAVTPSASLKGAQIYILPPSLKNMHICALKYGYLLCH